MWVKFEVIPSDREIIYLPSFVKMSYRSVEMNFGGKKVSAEVITDNMDDSSSENENSFDNPLLIKMSDDLRNSLLLQECLVYQFKIQDKTITIGPVIGLLLGTDTHRYTPTHMKKYSDRLGIYHKIGGLIYAFSPKYINWKNNTAYGLFYNIETSAWEYGRFPLPEVIYRRDFHSDPTIIDLLENTTQNRLFNSYRFTKYELFDFIGLNNDLKNHLPPTELSLSYEQVKNFIDQHAKVILKPLDLSRGRGLCIFEKLNSVYKVTDYRYGQPITTILNDNESLAGFFEVNDGLFHNYLVQKYLPLARIGNSIFDVRVVMQKHGDGNWGCTGIECRVSKENGYITNISKGGHALTLEESLEQSFQNDYKDIPRQIDDFCQRFCTYMDTMGKNFAEFGIDIAIDTDKNLWLIEANVFPSFKGFKVIDYQTYLNIRYTPMLYALSLTAFGELND